MNRNGIKLKGKLAILLTMVMVIFILVISSGSGKKGGRVHIPEDVLDATVIGTIEPLPRTALPGVKIYGPRIEPDTFKIVNYYGCPLLSWDELKRIRYDNPMQSIDVVVRIVLDYCTDDAGTVRVSFFDIVHGEMQAPGSAKDKIKSVLSRWRYTSYKSGEIYLRINEGRNEITYDVNRLIPCQQGKIIPNGDLWLIDGGMFNVTVRPGRLTRFRQ